MNASKLLGGLALIGVGIGAGILLDRQTLSRPSPTPTDPKPTRVVAATNTPALLPFKTNEVAAAFAAFSGETNAAQFFAALKDFTARLSPPTFPEALAFATNAPSQLSLNRARIGIIQEWTRQDHLGALQHLLSLPAEPWHPARILEVVEHWADKDAAAALEWAEQPANVRYLSDILSRVARKQAENDPEGALALAAKLPTVAARSSLQTTIFAAWAKKDPASAVKRMASMFPANRNTFPLRNVLAQWIELDAQAAADWLKEQPDNVPRRQLIHSATTSFAKTKPAVGAALIQSLPAGEDRQNAMAMLATAWAQSDAVAAYKWGNALPKGTERTQVLTAVLPPLGRKHPDIAAEFYLSEPLRDEVKTRFESFMHDYAQRDLQGAVELIRKFPATDGRDGVLHDLSRTLATKSPVEAVALTREISRPAERESALRNVISIWAGADGPTAAEFVAKQPTGRAREVLLAAVAGSWSARDLPAASAWLLALPPDGRADDAYRVIVSAHLETHPAQAAAFVDKLPASEQNIRLLNGLIHGWAKIDLEACAKWVERLPSATVRQTAFRVLTEQTLNVNPARAATFAEQASPDTSRYDDLRGKVALKWAASDPAAASTWALRVTTNDLPNHLSQLVQIWARHDPAAAMKFASDNARSFYRGDRFVDEGRRAAPYAFQSVLSQWARTDAKAAAAWLAARESEKEQQELCPVLLSQWGGRLEDAVAWLQSLPAKPWRDTAADIYLHNHTRSRPALAAQVALLVQFEPRQHLAFESVGREWLAADRAAARAWLEGTQLPATRKQKLLEGKAAP